MELTACLFQLEKREQQLIRSVMSLETRPLTFDFAVWTDGGIPAPYAMEARSRQWLECISATVTQWFLV